MTQIRGKHILITGGASGIGKLMAHGFAREQAKRITIWDIDSNKINSLNKDWPFSECELETFCIDITDPEAIEACLEQEIFHHNKLDILVNNAGVVGGKLFSEQEIRQIKNTIDVNVLGAMFVTRLLLPLMNKGGHIVNIASAASYTPNPKMSVYAASKWAMLGWSESIRLELKDRKDPIRVTTICPSYINTGMFDGVRAPLITPILRPEYASDKIISAIKKNRSLKRMPFSVNLLPIVRASLPGKVFDKVIGGWFGIYRSMNNFKGRY